LVKSSRAYKSSKRSRELARQKKQEEKRLRRIAKHQQNPDGSGPELDLGQDPEQGPGQEVEPGAETPESETPEDGTPPAA